MQGIYVVAPRWDGPCKIGITGEPSRRLHELMTGSSERLTVAYYAVYAAKAAGKFRFVARSLEMAVHKKLAECDVHRHGEWFDVSVPDAVATIKKCAEIMGAREITISDVANVDTSAMWASDHMRITRARILKEMVTARVASDKTIR